MLIYNLLFILNFLCLLRIPDSYDAKIAKFCNFWTFWPVTQLIDYLLKIRQKPFLPNTPSMEQWAKRLFVSF